MRWGELTEGKREAPEPLEGNIRAVVCAIAALWALAFLALLPFYGRLADEGRTNWLWTCLAGAALGLLGLWYVRAREAGLRAAAASAPDGDRPAGDDTPRTADPDTSDPGTGDPGTGAPPVDGSADTRRSAGPDGPTP